MNVAKNRTVDIITATLDGDPAHTHSHDRECDYTISWHDLSLFCGFEFDVYIIVDVAQCSVTLLRLLL